jgi:hypothetical protein
MGFFIATGDLPRAGPDGEDRLLSGWIPRQTDAGRFTSARDGGDLMVSFKCDYCILFKFYQRCPQADNKRDLFVMKCLHRINLETFWIEACSTVKTNAAKVREGLNISNRLSLTGPY